RRRLLVQPRQPPPYHAVAVRVPPRVTVPRRPAPQTFTQRPAGKAVPRAIGPRRVPQRRLEVGVLARAVVQHHVHEHFDTATVRLRYQPLEIVVGAVGWLDPVVIADIVAVIAGRLRHRHEPDA